MGVLCLCRLIQFTGRDQLVQHSHWPENAIDLAVNDIGHNGNEMRKCVTWTPKFQLSGPTVHSYTVT